MLLRQYTRLKLQDDFKYSDLKKVYTIIIYEKSASIFHSTDFKGQYFHHGKTQFNTGLTLELLQEYFLISLDDFRKNGYPKNESSLDMWLSLLSTESMDDVDKLIERYPQMEELFVDMSKYLSRPEEVLSMFSEALKIMDKNTVKYMMDELTEKLSDTENKLSDTENKLSDTENKLISTIVEMTKGFSGTKEQAVAKLVSECDKTESEAIELVEKYW